MKRNAIMGKSKLRWYNGNKKVHSAYNPHPNSHEIEEGCSCLIRIWFNFRFSGNKLKNWLRSNLFGRSYLLDGAKKLDKMILFLIFLVMKEYKICLIAINLDI